MFRAIRIATFGGPEQLKLAERTTLVLQEENQVLVNIKACAVNPVETYIRTGTHTIKPKLPFTPGNDGAGIIEQVGKDITHVKPGDRVYISKAITGTYAEQALCYGEYVHPLPDTLTYQEGAAISTAYLTAYRALIDRSNALPGERVLVHGASGGVGIACIQLCKLFGMQIYATASTPEGRTLIKNQGANHTFDHSAPNYMDEIFQATNGKGIDVILEMLANVNLSEDLKLLSQYGRVAIIGNRGNVTINPRDLMNRESSIRGVYLPLASPKELQRAHAALTSGFLSGSLKPMISTTLPLTQASLAHKLVMESGHTGKIILDMELQ